MNEDYACPLCGRDDYRCKCDWPMPTRTSVGEDADAATREAHRRCHWPRKAQKPEKPDA